MGIQFTPFDGVRAEPLKVPDPFDPPQGWTFHTLRSDAVAFRPFHRPLSRMRIAAESLQYHQKLIELQEAIDHDPESATGKSLMLLDEDTCAALEQQGEKLARLREAAPMDAATVAKLVVGWEGIVSDDGTPVPFSRDALISLLSDAGPMAVMNGDGPLVLRSGAYGGFTIGRALCYYLPLAIENLTLAESMEIQAKKTPPESPPSSGAGSGTKTTRSRSKRIASKASGD